MPNTYTKEEKNTQEKPPQTSPSSFKKIYTYIYNARSREEWAEKGRRKKKVLFFFKKKKKDNNELKRIAQKQNNSTCDGIRGYYSNRMQVLWRRNSKRQRENKRVLGLGNTVSVALTARIKVRHVQVLKQRRKKKKKRDASAAAFSPPLFFSSSSSKEPLLRCTST